ncbi:MAG: tyrosine-type recombinase/integrase [Steroidobacteraceae bacterium]
MLTETVIRAAKPIDKPRKVFDDRGLYLLIKTNGSRYWRFKYRMNGKEKLLALGVYPDVSLKRAREKRDEARTKVADGVDPALERQLERAAVTDTFKLIAEEFLVKQAKSLAPITISKSRWLLTLLMPHIGDKPIGKITGPEVLTALKQIEARGKHETAHRAKQKAGEVFRYAIPSGRCERDPTTDLRGALAKVVTNHRPALTKPKEVGQLLRAIDGFQGQPTTIAGLKLLATTCVRPGELRQAEWSEFDLETATWEIPAARMKMRKPHTVPLSKQAVAILKDLRMLTGNGTLAFPSISNSSRTMSENTLNGALRRLGYNTQTEMCSHGFRVVFSSLANQLGWNADVIEAQLAHQDENKVRRIYNRADHLVARKKMMQKWSDYLDTLRKTSSAMPPKL